MTAITRSGDDVVVHLTLDNPGRRNILDEEWWRAFSGVLDDLERMPELRVVTVTGAGATFSAGGDIGRMRESLDAMDAGTFVASERARMDRNAELLCRWVALPAFRIAAINGPAVGAGFALTLSCDHRLIAETAFVDTGFSRLGLPGDLGATYFLPRLIGEHRARAWLLRARRIAAAEAAGLGLVDVVCRDELLSEALTEAVDAFRAVSPDAATWVRQTARTAAELAEALAVETDATVACKQSAFHRDAVLAFAAASDRRPAEAKG